MKWYYDVNRIVKNLIYYISGLLLLSILLLSLIKIHIVIEAKGIIEPAESIYIKNKVAGKVKAIYCETGEYVKQGTILMELDDREALCKLNEARIELRVAKMNLKIKQLELNKKLEEYNLATTIYLSGKLRRNLNKPYEIIQAETELSNAFLSLQKAQESYTLAQIEYSNTKIKAEVSGVVYRYDVEDLINREIEVDRVLFIIGDTNTWQANLWVEEKYIADLKIGQKAEIDVKAYPGIRFKTLKGEITEIAGAIKRFDVGNFLNVKVRIVEPYVEYRLKPGMFVEAEITSIKRSILALLIESVI